MKKSILLVIALACLAFTVSAQQQTQSPAHVAVVRSSGMEIITRVEARQRFAKCGPRSENGEECGALSVALGYQGQIERTAPKGNVRPDFDCKEVFLTDGTQITLMVCPPVLPTPPNGGLGNWLKPKSTHEAYGLGY